MRLKVLTLNIWHGGMIFGPLLKFLKKENADILLIQEVYDGKDAKLEKRLRTFEIFKKELDYPYHIFAPAVFDTSKVENIKRGVATFSKFPVASSKTTFYDVPYGPFDIDNSTDYQLLPMNLLHTAIDGQKSINVFNTHGIWGWEGLDNKRRLQMSETILREAKGKENVIVAGDFNLLPSTKAVGNLKKHFKSVFDMELKTTFNMKRKVDPAFEHTPVDMIFVSKSIEIVDRYCPQVDVSDHLPLIAILNI